MDPELSSQDQGAAGPAAPCAWIVPAPDLTTASGRPHHLTERGPRLCASHCSAPARHARQLSQRAKSAKYDIERVARVRERAAARRAACAAALDEQMTAAAAKREQRLKKKSLESAVHVQHVKSIAAAARASSDPEPLRSQWEQRLSEAERRRSHRLRAKRRRCASQVQAAKERAATLRAQAEQLRAAQRRSQDARMTETQRRRQAALRERTIGTSRAARAAATLQQWWRAAQLLAALERFAELPLAAELAELRALDFEQLAELLNARSTLNTVATLLQRLVDTHEHELVLSKTAHRSTTLSKPRIFLSAYMVVLFPETILSVQDGVEEQRLQREATELLTQLRSACQALGSVADARQQRTALLAEFRTGWQRYLHAFLDWKHADERRLVQGLVAHYEELAALRTSVLATAGPDSPDAAHWLPNIARQQQQIRSRLRRLRAEHALPKPEDDDEAAAGEAAGVGAGAASASAKLLHMETKTSRRRRLIGQKRRKTTSECSEASEDDGGSTSVLTPRCASPADCGGGASSTAAAVSSIAQTPAGAALVRRERVGAQVEALVSRLMDEADRQVRGAEASVDDSEQQAQEQAQEQEQEQPSAGLLNAQLAHEIALDPDFVLTHEHGEERAFEDEVRKVARKALDDVLREDFSKTPPDYTRVPALVGELRDGLIGITLDRHTRLRDQIASNLDPAFVKQQVDQGAFEPRETLGYAVRMMEQLCAPARDAQVQALGACQDLASFFGMAHDLVEDMRLDLANFHIRAIRPFIQQQAVDYERAKFAASFDSGELSLEATQRWVAAAYREAAAAAAAAAGSSSASSSAATTPASSPEMERDTPAPAPAPSASAVIEEAFMQLLRLPDLAQCDALPETWRMDAKRLDTLRHGLLSLALSAAALTLTVNAVPSLRGDEAFAQRLVGELSTILADEPDVLAMVPNVALQAVQTAQAVLAEGGKARLTDADVAKVTALLETLSSPQQPVRRLLFRRTFDAVRRTLHDESSAEAAAATVGVSAVKEPLRAVARSASILAAHNRSVFAQWYDKLIQQARSEEKES